MPMNGTDIKKVNESKRKGLRFRKTGADMEGRRKKTDVIGKVCGMVPTLSVSIVATSSSAAMLSPTFFCHVLSVPSEMDSAICGTLTVSASPNQAPQTRCQFTTAPEPATQNQTKTRAETPNTPFNSFVVWNEARRVRSLERACG